MNALLATAIGAAIGSGVLLVLQGLRGRAVLPAPADLAPGVDPEVALAWFSAGLIGGLVVLAVTGWPVAAIVVGVGLVFGHRLVGNRREREAHVARTEAIAAWAERIRDNMAAAAGLEQALIASAAYAPEPIAPEVRRFASRLDRMSLLEALQLLSDDLAHPSADMIVVSLANAARTEARELGPLLSRLVESIRGDVRMRLRVEVGRARIRTSARIVIATTVVTAVLMFALAPQIVEPYGSLTGQIWLSVVIGVFAIGGWILRAFADFEMPQRFTARPVVTPSAVDRAAR